MGVGGDRTGEKRRALIDSAVDCSGGQGPVERATARKGQEVEEKDPRGA